jgi:acetoin utilization deacetylase AcuC-like enzyme
MPTTAFVSHSDCARHDTGWNHADHQGRLPALVRAVYRDMLTLHGHLLEVEAVPVSVESLLRVHTPGYVERVRAASEAAAAAGAPQPFEAEVTVSAASWEAALASAGAAVTGVEAVVGGRARNAFCASRPPGAEASADCAGGFAIFNNVAIAARHARERLGLDRVLVVEWSGSQGSRISEVLASDAGVGVLRVGLESVAADPLGTMHVVSLPAGSRGELFATSFATALEGAVAEFRPSLMILAAGFDVLDADPYSSLSLEPRDIHAATSTMVRTAEAECDGRLVSVLEGGFDTGSLGAAVVQHVRALASLPAA